MGVAFRSDGRRGHRQGPGPWSALSWALQAVEGDVMAGHGRWAGGGHCQASQPGQSFQGGGQRDVRPAGLGEPGPRLRGARCHRRHWRGGSEDTHPPQVPSSREENARSQEEEGEKSLRDSGNFSNQLLVRQRKCFLMFRLIIDQHSSCLIAASCRLTRGPRCGRWWSGGTPGVAATPHQSPSVRRCGR